MTSFVHQAFPASLMKPQTKHPLLREESSPKLRPLQRAKETGEGVLKTILELAWMANPGGQALARGDIC